MSEFTMDRLRENLEALKMKNTLEILDNYLERAVADKLNIVEVLDHIFSEEAKSKRRRAYEKQIQMSGFRITLDSTVLNRRAVKISRSAKGFVALAEHRRLTAYMKT